MHDASFDVSVIVETTNPGEFPMLASVSQAAVFLIGRRPAEHGPQYRTALRACIGRLASRNDVENARRAFLVAANEAGLLVKHEDEEADLAPQRDENITPPSATEEKPLNRVGMEEEEEFLVRFLSRETGIAEAQARDLINMIGIDRSSLLREARKLKARH
ncbi:DUF982 domain-containing protein [Mesorhizobium kowhaii]|uniref:DUF982 domain-containing protein n=1 Tax=Mesorhizobium kowhaii TaxID=1300272 RepID=UPI0035EC6D41